MLIGNVAVVHHMNMENFSEQQIQSVMDFILNKLPNNTSQIHAKMYPEVILLEAEADSDESSEQVNSQKEKAVKEVLNATFDVNEEAVDVSGLTSETENNIQTCRNATRQNGNQARYCQYCEKTFKRSSNLKAHMETIPSGISVPCPYCDKSYTNTGNMTVHIKTVHDGEKFPCNFCTKIFIQKRGLVKHKATMHSDLDISRRSGRQTIA